MEHGGIGRAYGEADYAHDVRLACHGLGTEDNDFHCRFDGQRVVSALAACATDAQNKTDIRIFGKIGTVFYWESDLAREGTVVSIQWAVFSA